MKGTQEAPGPDAGGNAGVPGETEHVVTTMLRSDAMILMLARKAIEEGDGSPAAHIAARQHRETLIESALADYYHAAATAERIRDTARRKCEELLAETERAANPQDEAAAQAVRRLRDLLGGIPETAELCGLSAAAVRDLLADRRADQDAIAPGRAAHPAGDLKPAASARGDDHRHRERDHGEHP